MSLNLWNLAKKYCPIRLMVVWIKRATGIGYREFPPLNISSENTKKLRKNSDDLVIQIEQLERDLRRRGQLS